MKKLFMIITALLMLSACNAPTSEVPTEDLIGTAVAVALTNAPTNTPIPPTAAPPTAVPELPTETATSIPSATPTEAPTPTPTLNPQDPALQYGSPDKIEDFSTITGAWNYEDDWSSWNVNDGFLNIYSKGTPYWHSWYTTGQKIQNFYLEAELSMPNCSGKDRIGLAFRLTEGSRFYFMGLTCDGTWGFNRYTASNASETILAYQPSDKIRPTNETNRIGVLANGNSFGFYINGALVGSVSDDTYPGPGTTGFVSMSAGTVNFKTSVDVLRYWLLP